MIELSDSETRFKDILKNIGIADENMKMPDKDASIIGTADFLVGDVVFEVKKIVPDKKDKINIDKQMDNIKKRRVEFLWVSDKTKQFKADVKSARGKFKVYSNCATVLVEDLTDWALHEPDIERMMFGTESIHIDNISGGVLGKSWQNRILTVNTNRRIGSYIFVTASRMLIYHNLMAEEFKMMPIEFIQKFNKATPFQYIFVNIPGSQSLVRQIM
jgi:hypothetical protein